MPTRANYYLECPTCGRSLRLLVSLLGREVVCGHCRRQFVAIDRQAAAGAAIPGLSTSLERAEQLLSRIDCDRKNLVGAGGGLPI